ncbi:MAG: peptidoglycan-binding domain-containing protein [Rhodanobacter sp.]
MPDSTTITREQLRTVLMATELGGQTGDSDHFSYARLANSTYSFGEMQFDVGNNPDAKAFLKDNGFDSTDILDLGRHGGLTRERLDTLDAKLQAIPQATRDQFTNDQLDQTIAGVGDIIDDVRNISPGKADAITQDQKLQLGIADYTNQFGPPYTQLTGYLAGKEETLGHLKVQAGNPPTREDVQTFIGSGKYGQNPANARGIEGRAARFEGAMQELNLSPRLQTIETLKEHAKGTEVHNLQSNLATLGYTDAKGHPLQVDGQFGPATVAAVKAFQADHQLTQDGQFGPKTQQAMQARLQPLNRDDPGLLPSISGVSSLPAAAAPGLDDPRNAFNPSHALYNTLKERIPAASENRLLQFTGACHSNKITADNLSTIHLNGETGKMFFSGTSFMSTVAVVDVKTPSPAAAQSIQHIQQYDQQHAQMMGQIQAQNAQQNNVQGQQGPVLGGR